MKQTRNWLVLLGLGCSLASAGADVSALVGEMDEWVAALYGLTPEEKAIVQSASVQTRARQGHAAK